MKNSTAWAGPTLIVIALLFGCQQRSAATKIDEAQALARDAYAEAESAKAAAADLETRVSELESRLDQ